MGNDLEQCVIFIAPRLTLFIWHSRINWKTRLNKGFLRFKPIQDFSTDQNPFVSPDSQQLGKRTVSCFNKGLYSWRYPYCRLAEVGRLMWWRWQDVSYKNVMPWILPDKNGNIWLLVCFSIFKRFVPPIGSSFILSFNHLLMRNNILGLPNITKM